MIIKYLFLFARNNTQIVLWQCFANFCVRTTATATLPARIYRKLFMLTGYAFRIRANWALSGDNPETDGGSEGNLLNFIFQKLHFDVSFCFCALLQFTSVQLSSVEFLLNGFRWVFVSRSFLVLLIICHFYSYENIRMCFISTACVPFILLLSFCFCFSYNNVTFD